MRGLGAEVVLRSRSTRVLACCVIAIAAAAFFGLLARGDAAAFARAAGPLALLALGAWAAFWRPAVLVGPARVVVVNPLRTVEVTWPAVQDVETRWALALVTASGRYTAWAAPAPTRVASGMTMPRDRWGRPDVSRMHDDPARLRATGDVAAYLVRRQWEEYRDRGLLGRVEGPGVVVRVHRGTVATGALLAVASVLALALH